MRNPAVDEILLTTDAASDLVRRFYDLRKAENAKYSLVFLCRAAGIKSKGYLADVMKGRRKLNPEYWDGLSHGFALDGIRSDLFHMLLRLDALDPDVDATELKTEILSHRKSIASTDDSLPERLRGMFFAFEVFCAFGLFKNQPTREDLRGHFGRAMGVELDAALHLLTSSGLATLDGPRYKLLKETVVFSDSEDGISHLNFLRLSIEDAMRNIDKWQANKAQAFFESNMISVRSKDFLQVLPRIKEEIRKTQINLEASDADMILRFNVQIYPTR